MRKSKRGPCRFFLQGGSCRKGDMCEYEHVRGGGGHSGSDWPHSRGSQGSYSRGSHGSHFPRRLNPPRPFDSTRSKEEHKYCVGFQRGECTNLQHTNHVLPSGLERKTILEMDHGQGAEIRETIGVFTVNTNQFGVCTDMGTLNIWNDSFVAVDKRSLGIPCSAVACFNNSSKMLLIFGSYFQTAPAPNQYGICVTDGTNGFTFPVLTHT